MDVIENLKESLCSLDDRYQWVSIESFRKLIEDLPRVCLVNGD